MVLDKHSFLKILKLAREKVCFVGVVPFVINWVEVAEVWSKTLQGGTNFRISLLCESDNMLFEKAFTCDLDSAEKRHSFADLKFIRDEALDLKEHLSACTNKELVLSNVQVEIMHLPIPIAAVLIDDQIFANPWLHEFVPEIEEISESHSWYKPLKTYIEAYLDPSRGRKFACEPNQETLELFDHNRIPRGIFPRGSFYDTDYSQLVVWALIFDRKGRLLIHKRSATAKDNRQMWDKSVGGHVDFMRDVDSSHAICREVIEEIFTDELKIHDLKTWDITDEEMINLGEWLPERRKKYPFEEINHFSREWVFFKLRRSQHLYSPRIMHDGRRRGLRIIADVYLFVAGSNLNDNSLGELRNSEFKFIDPADLKNAMDKAGRMETILGFDKERDVPLFSPDLTNIMTGELRDVLIGFSNFIKRYIRD